MPIMECSQCRHVSNIKSTSQCVRCAAIIIIPPKKSLSKSQKIIFSTIFGVFVLGFAAYGVIYFISWQQEQTRLELEKKQLDEFDTINFKADADSFANAQKSLPIQFKLQQPPTNDEIKLNVNGFKSAKQESSTATIKKNIKHKTPVKLDTICNNGSVIGRLGPAIFTNGGCTGGTHLVESSINISETTTTVTSYKVLEFEPIEYDYVKGRGNNLVCFVTYQATIGKFNRIFPNPYGAKNSWVRDPETNKLIDIRNNKLKDIGTKVGEHTVKETARYDLTNGNWIFKEAGLSEFNKTLRIDEVRIEAQNKQQ